MNDNNKDRIIKQFNRLAPDWASRYGGWFLLRTPTLRLRRRYFLQLLKNRIHLPKSAKIVDVGCGTGDILSDLQQKGYKFLVGCDISGEMIATAKRSFPEVEFFVADMDELTRSQIAQGCDLLILLGVLSYYPDPIDKLNSLKMILSNDGYILFSYQNADSPFQKVNIRRMANSKHYSFSPNLFEEIEGLEIVATKRFGFFVEPSRLRRIPFFSMCLYYLDSFVGAVLGGKYATSVLVLAKKMAS